APHHLREVLAPRLRRMGVEIDVMVVRPGHVPGGAGILQITVTPADGGLIGLALVDPGQVREVRGIALASRLADRRVSERMGATVDRHLADQLVLFAALAHGRSGYVVPQVTDHVLSNAWLVSQFGATVGMAGKSVTVDGINLKRRVVP